MKRRSLVFLALSISALCAHYLMNRPETDEAQPARHAPTRSGSAEGTAKLRTAKPDAPSLAANVDPSQKQSAAIQSLANPVFKGVRGPAQVILARDEYDELPLLDAFQTPPDSKGTFKRARLIEDRSKKYSRLLVEEFWQVGKDGSKLANRLVMVGDHLMVQLKSSVSRSDLEALLQTLNARIRRELSTPGLYLVEFEARDVKSLRVMMEKLRASSLIQYPEPDYVVGL